MSAQPLTAVTWYDRRDGRRKYAVVASASLLQEASRHRFQSEKRMVWLVVGPCVPLEVFCRQILSIPTKAGCDCAAMASSDSYLLLLGEKIRQHIETRRQENKNVSPENIPGGWSPPTDYVLPYLEEMRSNWINKKTSS